MIDKNRNRWLISIVLIVAVVAFAGVSFAPAIQAFLQSRNDTEAANNANAATPEAATNELATQARGYELVLEREPDNQTALRGLIDARIQLGDIAGVIEPIQKLVELNPGQTEYAVLLAQAQQQVGDLEAAAQTYRTVLSERPGDMNALRGLVTLLVNQERPQAAIGLLQDTLQTADEANQVQPGSVDVTSVQLLLGQVYAEQGQFEEAIALYDAEIERSPEDFRPLLAKAIVLQSQGRNEEATSLFTAASALAPAQYKDQITQMSTANATGVPGLDGTSTPANPDEIPADAMPESAAPDPSTSETSESDPASDE